MTKGKYAVRADTRLKALESAALRDAHAKITELEAQLGQAKHQLDTAEANMHGQAMTAAAGMSRREKQHLRNKIASLEHQAGEERVRNALLTWELMHRFKFGRPSPAKLLDPKPDCGDTARPMIRELPPDADVNELQESYDYWIDVHWEIAALFMSNYDEIWRFQEIAQGYRWGIAGFWGANARENTRNVRTTSGRISGHLIKRVNGMRDYYQRIWKARLAGGMEPVSHWEDVVTDDMAPADRRDALVKKMRARHG
jgi:hypothetical protein